MYIYENSEPGQVVQIFAQPTEKGADASVGGGAPPNANPNANAGVLQAPSATKLATIKDTLINVGAATSTAEATSVTNSKNSINVNKNDFALIWRRDSPVCYYS